MRTRAVTAVLAVAVLAVGCSSGDEGGDGTSESTQSETPTAVDQCDERNLATVEGVPSFYDPCPYDAGEPGDVVAVEAAPDAPDGTDARRVLYHSKTIAGTDSVVSALVVAPTSEAPSGGFPVVSFAHPTTGTARQCAPSLRPSEDDGDPQVTEVSFYELVDPFVKSGFAVIATDYLGLGTPSPHPYLVGEAEGNNVLDAARAVRNLDGLTLSDDTLIFGHSQGGQAAAFAAELAADYAPELKVLGAAELAPAAELGDLFEKELSDPKLSSVGLAVMALRQWQIIYPEAKEALGALLTEQGAKDLEKASGECLTAVYDRFESTDASTLFTSDPAKDETMKGLLSLNTAGQVADGLPTFVGQGTADEIVLPETTETYVSTLCGLGETVDFKKYEGATHDLVVIEAMPDVLEWMKDRLAGKPAPNTC